ncbi:MAG: hypothetical protein NTZ83_04005, partial [Candidatus Pacearchaeota archaeon]|nr:hypothetical protein [Candidatus Pacearchaeota archaeon]
ENLKDRYGKEENRLFPSFVPNDFVLRTDTFGKGSYIDNRSKVAFGGMYLKQCLGTSRDVADVFANYFCSSEEINTARVRTKSIKYLPRYSEDPNSPHLEIGYGQFLPRDETELINTAVALYMITDEEGKVDFNKIPKQEFPRGKYTEMLRLPE